MIPKLPLSLLTTAGENGSHPLHVATPRRRAAVRWFKLIILSVRGDFDMDDRRNRVEKAADTL